MNAFKIRQATLADVPAVASLFDLYRQFYDMAPDEPLALHFIQERMEKGQSAIFVAEDADGGIVGFCQIYFSFCSVFAGSICILNDLFVLPAIRGSGIGAVLLNRAEAFAAERGAVRINLQTARTNHRAQQLYETRGWSRNTTLDGYSKRLT
ncbi:MAG: GNAT family N-acetyltransferase [Sphingomonadales bacterium]